MSKNENQEQKTEQKESSSKGPMTAVFVVAVIVAMGAAYSLTQKSKGGAGDAADTSLAKIAPAAADDSKAADAAKAADTAVPEKKFVIKDKDGNPVVAVVDGKEIMRGDVFNFISGLPQQWRQNPIQTLFPFALEQVVNNRIVNAKASEADLKSDAEVMRLLDQAQGQIIHNVYLDRKVKESLSEERLQNSYKDFLKSLPKVQETKARHILVETEEAARALIKKLDEGADFEELAKESSTGPSAERGGDLGYFAKTDMVPEFADTAFALGIGKYTEDPVKTKFGWHVIKAEDRRERPEPTFDSVKQQLDAQVRQQILSELLLEWQKGIEITKFDINGEPLPAKN